MARTFCRRSSPSHCSFFRSSVYWYVFAGRSRAGDSTRSGCLMADQDPSRITPGEWGLLLVLAAVQVTHILDFVIIMPLGPQLTVSLEITAQQFGWIVSAYGFAASLSGLAAA